jgi:hypothetical protein
MTPGMLGQREVGTTHAHLPLSKAVLQSQDLSQSLDLKTVRCSTEASLVPQVQVPQRTSGVSFEKRFVGKGREDLGDVHTGTYVPVTRSRAPALSTLETAQGSTLSETCHSMQQPRSIPRASYPCSAKSMLLPLPSAGRRDQAKSDCPFRHITLFVCERHSPHGFRCCRPKLAVEAVSAHHQSEDAIDRSRPSEDVVETSPRLSSPHEHHHQFTGRPHLPKIDYRCRLCRLGHLWPVLRILLSESLVESLILPEPIEVTIAYASNRRLKSPYYRRIIQS